MFDQEVQRSPTGINHENFIRLEAHLRSLHPDEFDMSKWHKCLCGHIHKLKDEYPTSCEKSLDSGAAWLGINHNIACRMFAGRKASPTDAADMLKTYRETGHVIWFSGGNDWPDEIAWLDDAFITFHEPRVIRETVV